MKQAGSGRRSERMDQPSNSVVPNGALSPKGVAAGSVDVALGVVAKSRSAMVIAGGPLKTFARPLAHVMLRPPLLPSRLQPATWLTRAARRGVEYRSEVLSEVQDVLDRLIPAVVSELLHHVDLNQLVKQNVDVVTLAEEVIAEIDLPAIIRDSTGAVASDTLLGVRMQSISADAAIGRAMDRLRLRLARRTAVTTTPARAT
jgi:hypothetical protein